MEPSGPVVPAGAGPPASRRHLTPAAAAEGLRLAALVVAGGLLLAGRGPLGLAAVLVVVGATTWAGALAGSLALAAAGLRWSTTSLAAVAGAQAVLGPAVAVGSAGEAAVSALAAAGALLAVPAGRGVRDRLTVVVLGLVAAGVALAPASGGGVPTRAAALAAGVVAAGVLTVVPRARQRAAAGVVAAGLGVVLALLAR